MTLNEAIERYTSNAEYERTHGDLQGCLEFRQLAEWLKDYKRLKEQEPCEDCVSRQQAIDKMQELEEEDIEAYGCSIPEGFDGKRAIEALKALLSVHPKSKMGHWVKVIEENGHAFYLCPVCKEGTDDNYDFCPFCGSKNGGSE